MEYQPYFLSSDGKKTSVSGLSGVRSIFIFHVNLTTLINRLINDFDFHSFNYIFRSDKHMA